MKKTVFLLLTSLLVACGGGSGGNESPDPVAPVTETPTPPPPVVTPPPVVPPTPPPPPVQLDVTIGDPGDIFKPVVVTVEGGDDWEYTVSIGRVERTETGLEIYSDGRLGDGILTVDDEAYQYTIVEEPVCEGTKDGLTIIDCIGVQQGGGTPWYIYYGEDDKRVVTWEILYIGRTYTDGDGPVLPDARLQLEAENTIKTANEKLSQWGVYVELKLVGVFGFAQPNGNTAVIPYIQDGTFPDADFIAVQGALPDGICGQSGVPSKFRGRTFPLRFLNGCGIVTWLHEMGHSAGLGHGDNFGQNSGSGSTFFFAQGGSMCGYRSDIMQYGGSTSEKAFSNHKITCGQMYNLRPDQDYYDDPAGIQDFGGPNTGYALNRVRYDIALVHNEHEYELDEAFALQYIEVKSQPKERIIDD